MPHIKPRHLNSQHGIGYHASFLGVADGAITKNDIVIASGYSGDRIKFKKADANSTPLAAGVMGIADHAAPTGGNVRVVSHKLITGVDTSDAAAAGYPVYLSVTAGGWTVARAAGPIVGTVVEDHASTGAVLLSIAHTSSEGLESVAYGASTSVINSGAADTAISIIQPAGTVIIDAGFVVTTATVGSSTNGVKFGTALDGAEICAVGNLTSSNVAAIGSSIQVSSAAQGQGNASITFVDDAPLYTATERTIFSRFEADATITAGVVRPFIRFIRI